MGRMIDILRTADRRPGADAPPAAEPLASTVDEADDEPAIPDTEIESEFGPPIEDDNDVPFIEVGGGREPTLRLVAAPPAPAIVEAGPEVRVFPPVEQPPSTPIPLPQS